jgi:L-ascorbate metabolism protein UlaG (beta-lactamase superfamily)
MRAALFIVALAVPFPLPAAEPGPQDPLCLTYLANEGFLITGAGRKVLVDALHHATVPEYPAVPAATLADLEAARGPFAGVDLVLATHHHGDHFDPQAVGRHLLANRRARFVSTPQAVAQLREGFAEYGQIAERVVAVYPAEGEHRELELGIPGLALTALNLTHGRREPPIENLGFLLELAGHRLLHAGDTVADEKDLAGLDLPSARIDLALLPYWLLLDGGHEAVERNYRPRRVVAIHLPRAAADAAVFGATGSLARLQDQLAELPGVRVFRAPGETRPAAELLAPEPAAAPPGP